MVAIGCLFPWVTVVLISIRGFDTDYGQVALVAALVGVALAALRHFSYLGEGMYLLTGTLAAGIAAGTCAWFIFELKDDAPPGEDYLDSLRMAFWFSFASSLSAVFIIQIQTWATLLRKQP